MQTTDSVVRAIRILLLRKRTRNKIREESFLGKKDKLKLLVGTVSESMVYLSVPATTTKTKRSEKMSPTQKKEFYKILDSGRACEKIQRLKELTGQTATPDLTGLDRASEGQQEFYFGGQFFCSESTIRKYVPTSGFYPSLQDIQTAYPSATYYTLGGRPFYGLEQ
jgi:hypothetical protein